MRCVTWFGATCDALRDLILFAQFKKRKNTHGEVTLLHGCFHVFKLYKWYQIAQHISYKCVIVLFHFTKWNAFDAPWKKHFFTLEIFDTILRDRKTIHSVTIVATIHQKLLGIIFAQKFWTTHYAIVPSETYRYILSLKRTLSGLFSDRINSLEFPSSGENIQMLLRKHEKLGHDEQDVNFIIRHYHKIFLFSKFKRYLFLSELNVLYHMILKMNLVWSANESFVHSFKQRPKCYIRQFTVHLQRPPLNHYGNL